MFLPACKADLRILFWRAEAHVLFLAVSVKLWRLFCNFSKHKTCISFEYFNEMHLYARELIYSLRVKLIGLYSKYVKTPWQDI